MGYTRHQIRVEGSTIGIARGQRNKKSVSVIYLLIITIQPIRLKLEFNKLISKEKKVETYYMTK